MTLASIGAYIGVMVFEGFVAWILIKADLQTHFMTVEEFQSFVWLGVLVSVALGAVYFLICRYLMDKRLNLA